MLALAAPLASFTTNALANSAYEWFPRHPGLTDDLYIVHRSDCGDPWVPTGTPTLTRLVNPGDHAWLLEFDVRTDPCTDPRPTVRTYAIPVPASIGGIAVQQLYVEATNAVGTVTAWVMPLPTRMSLPPSTAGTWFHPSFAYQGLLINYTGDAEVAISWNTYDADGRPSWHVGIAPLPDDAAVVEVPLTDVPAGVFAGAPEQPVAPAPWGTVTLEYLGCGELELHWSPDAGTGLPSGHATLTQMTDGFADACDLARWSDRQHAELVVLEPTVIGSAAAR